MGGWVGPWGEANGHTDSCAHLLLAGGAPADVVHADCPTEVAHDVRVARAVGEDLASVPAAVGVEQLKRGHADAQRKHDAREQAHQPCERRHTRRGERREAGRVGW